MTGDRGPSYLAAMTGRPLVAERRRPVGPGHRRAGRVRADGRQGQRGGSGSSIHLVFTAAPGKANACPSPGERPHRDRRRRRRHHRPGERLHQRWTPTRPAAPGRSSSPWTSGDGDDEAQQQHRHPEQPVRRRQPGCGGSRADRGTTSCTAAPSPTPHRGRGRGRLDGNGGDDVLAREGRRRATDVARRRHLRRAARAPTSPTYSVATQQRPYHPERRRRRRSSGRG